MRKACAGRPGCSRGGRCLSAICSGKAASGGCAWLSVRTEAVGQSRRPPCHHQLFLAFRLPREHGLAATFDDQPRCDRTRSRAVDAVGIHIPLTGSVQYMAFSRHRRARLSTPVQRLPQCGQELQMVLPLHGHHAWCDVPHASHELDQRINTGTTCSIQVCRFPGVNSYYGSMAAGRRGRGTALATGRSKWL